MTYEQDAQMARDLNSIAGLLSNLDTALGRIAEAIERLKPDDTATETFRTGDGKTLDFPTRSGRPFMQPSPMWAAEIAPRTELPDMTPAERDLAASMMYKDGSPIKVDPAYMRRVAFGLSVLPDLKPDTEVSNGRGLVLKLRDVFEPPRPSPSPWGPHGLIPDVPPRSARDSLVHLDLTDASPDAIIVRTHDGRELNLEQLLNEHRRLIATPKQKPVPEDIGSCVVQTSDGRKLSVAELLIENRNLRENQKRRGDDGA